MGDKKYMNKKIFVAAFVGVFTTFGSVNASEIDWIKVDESVANTLLGAIRAKFRWLPSL